MMAKGLLSPWRDAASGPEPTAWHRYSSDQPPRAPRATALERATSRARSAGERAHSKPLCTAARASSHSSSSLLPASSIAGCTWMESGTLRDGPAMPLGQAS